MKVTELPESTRQEMAAFFMRTSIPRILAAEKKRKGKGDKPNDRR